MYIFRFWVRLSYIPSWPWTLSAGNNHKLLPSPFKCWASRDTPPCSAGRSILNVNKTSRALIFSIYIPSCSLNIVCLPVIRNICCFSAAFYRQLAQQKVLAPQYVLLSSGVRHCDERIPVQWRVLSFWMQMRTLPTRVSWTKRKTKGAAYSFLFYSDFRIFLLWGGTLHQDRTDKPRSCFSGVFNRIKDFPWQSEFLAKSQW